ncbi:MAG: hypothetical protein R3C60_09945 [Parvularculaceae bacterium]
MTEAAVSSPALDALNPPPINTDGANWRLESGDEIFEGDLVRHFTLDGKPMIQLINRDGINLGFVIDGNMVGEQTVSEAFFIPGRGPRCDRVGPPEMFTIRFVPAEAGWLAGTFKGMLGCADYRAMPVTGSFHVEAP